MRSARDDEAGTRQSELRTPEHLTLDGLELGDAPFGLAVRPGLDDRCGVGLPVGVIESAPGP
jgi:hypothetical protein